MPLILVAEDNSESRYLLDVLLRKNGFETVSAANGREALEMARATPPDLIVSDILMPIMDGFALCKEWKSDDRLGQIPFIFYTATYTEPKDIEFGLSLGADRFLTKPQEVEVLLSVFREVLSGGGTAQQFASESSLEEEMEFLRHHNETLFRKLEKKMADLEAANRTLRGEIEKRQSTEKSLRESQEKLQTLLDTLPVGLLWADAEGTIQYVNGKFVELFGYVAEEIRTIKNWFLHAHPDPMERESLFSFWTEAMETAQQTGAATPAVNVRLSCKDGSFRDVSVVGAVAGTSRLATFSDLTEQKRLQEQLLQSQKLESIGNLASGIAHDFNNVLTTVTGFAGLLQMHMQKTDPLLAYVNELAAAGMRGAALTHQLLAFGRKQILDIRPVDLNETLKSLQKMLRRLIREDISLSFYTSTEAMPVLADANQIGQVVINLVTNARDAMPKGGSLAISTAKREISASFVRKRGYGEPGVYAVVSVADDGLGMDEGTKAKIFEPFFTTKEVDKGTGLGLAVVYGIVRQHKGIVIVESEPGKGARFDVCLPLVSGNVDVEKHPGEAASLRNGSETILLAEDDDMIRAIATDVLKSRGYKVLPARDGQEAVAIFNQQAGAIDMVVFDLIMPKKRGFDAYLEISRQAPLIKALFVTGYSEAEVERGELRKRNLPLLLKPYTPADLLKKIRDLLDGNVSTC